MHYLPKTVETSRHRRRSHAAFTELQRLFSCVLDALPQHICVTDELGNILKVNESWRHFATENGMPADTVWEQQNYFAVTERAAFHGLADARTFLDQLHQVASGAQDAFSIEYACHSADEQRWFNVKLNRFQVGGFTRIMIAHENVSPSRRVHDALVTLSSTDILTGLPNRATLHDFLKQSMAHAQRVGSIVWTVFLDLDRFKLVKETLGFTTSDQVLCAAAKRLQSSLRKSDMVARFSGDQFVLVLPDPGEDTQAVRLLTHLLSVVAQPFFVEEQEFFLSCSLGITVFPGDGSTADVLIDRANAAMYLAKQSGRNNFKFYAPTINHAALEQLRLEQQLRQAVSREEFVLHYQPQVDLCSGAIVGVEALIRWQHPDRGLLSPDIFIGLAEENGLILPIGAWVLRTACRQASDWQRDGLPPIRIAINLSARQFEQPDLVAMISSTLAETGLDPRYLDLELTETAVTQNFEETTSTLHELKKLGVQVSIDDFGTGYSSLSYLKRFPIDVLKIDRSFVSDITLANDDGTIPNAIIAMAHSLGINVVAEGVETSAQCEFLSRNMCDEIQGYWFSPPLPQEGVATLLREGKCLPPHLLRMQQPQRVLLLVDDEQNVISALRRMLRPDGYHILTANSGQEGLNVLLKSKVDVILSDQRMPGMTGVEFLRNVKTLHPETVRIVLSGFTELQSVTDAVNEGAIYKFLTKPWDDALLRGHISEAFRHKEMTDENRRLNMAVHAANHRLAQSNRQLGDALQTQSQQITRDEITLNIVREALLHVPLPMIGIDEDAMVAFANIAAHQLFAGVGSILGTDAASSMPEILEAIQGTAEGEKSPIRIATKDFGVAYRSMGNGTLSRGMLITLTPASWSACADDKPICLARK